MDRLRNQILNGRDIKTAFDEERDILMRFLNAPSIPMTYDTVVEDGIRMSRLFPISVTEAEQKRKERTKTVLSRLAPFL